MHQSSPPNPLTFSTDFTWFWLFVIVAGLAAFITIAMLAIVTNRPRILVGIGALLLALFGFGGVLLFVTYLAWWGMASEAKVRQTIVAREEVQFAESVSRLQELDQHIAQTDISKLMDKADAPRIQLESDGEAASEPSLSHNAKPNKQELAGVQQIKSKGDPEVKTVDIEFDRKKLEDAGLLSFESIDRALGRRGLWRGLSKQADSDEMRIEVRGEFEDDYVAKLSDTLLGTKGRLEHPVYVRDVATITTRSGSSSSVEPRTETTTSDGGEAATWASDAAWSEVPENAPRPSWLHSPPKRVGEVWREAIVTDEYSSPGECLQATDVYLLLKTYEHIQELIGHPMIDSSLPSISFNGRTVTADGTIMLSSDGGTSWNWSDPRLRELKSMGIGVDFVRREIVAKDGANGGESSQYFEELKRSVGPMLRLHTLIEFTPSIDKELRRRWEVGRRDANLAMVGTGAGGILALLGLIFGLLKVDTWTKGYYTKRLFLGVPAAIIGLGAALALLVG